VELLVAMMAGLMVAAAAFSFSKQSTRVFAQEARVSSAQMSVLTGFQRLQADVARASYMSTPDMLRDLNFNRVCAPGYNDWPEAMQELTGLRVTSTDGAPDVVRITGNLSSAEMFPVRAIAEDAAGSGHIVYLQANTGPITRAGFLEDGKDYDAAFKEVFKAGRLLRILDQEGRMEFEVIKDSSYVLGGQPLVVTFGPLPLKGELSTELGSTSAPCGIAGFGVGVQANPVSVVEYRIASLASVPPYRDTIYHNDYYVEESDDNRMELVRSEVLFAEQAGGGLSEQPAPELVAEFAVDLQIGVRTSAGGPGLTYFPPGSVEDLTEPAATDQPGNAATGPTAIRTVELRLVVRSREPDRAGDTDPDDPLRAGGFMFRAPVNGQFARARTLLADVALMNQRGDAW
jgi:hypothetical protein